MFTQFLSDPAAPLLGLAFGLIVLVLASWAVVTFFDRRRQKPMQFTIKWFEHGVRLSDTFTPKELDGQR